MTKFISAKNKIFFMDFEKLKELVLRLKSIPDAESEQRLKELILKLKPATDIEISERLRKKLLDLEESKPKKEAKEILLDLAEEPSVRIHSRLKNLRKCSKCGILTTSFVCLLCGCPTV
ncbi:MAG: hypothetical protein CEE43_02265 [Promethearchaeota archaeon Loki_b32]|nr:MAG: hypothetical protein CEE43_02265 [Candidatus Lokiarchaeota archaeon Loki_b32]